jgi:hypothetical protein
MSQSANKQAYILVDPSIDCHQRLRWETPPEPSAPPPLVSHQQWFVPVIRRPERIIYGYGDASDNGAAGLWYMNSNVFLWRIPMGLQPSPADSLSRWRTEGDEEFLRRIRDAEVTVGDLVSRLQIAEGLEEAEEMEPMEYVD